jgi:cyclophilin family peptidyl-prolyl cis-trans isomerase
MTESLLKTLVPLLAAAALAGCGGGGDAGSQPPVVTTAFTSTPRYGSTLTVTLRGSRLDQGIAASSPGCRNVTLSTTAPLVSTATEAYFQCTVSGDGAQQLNVTRTSDGALIASPPFTVPSPQVTLDIANGAGVSGSLVITLSPNQAPVTVENFLTYVAEGFYVNTVFHRNSPGFVLQGGGYAAPLAAAGPFVPKPTPRGPIVLEVGKLSNLRYTLAMARGNTANSATSQFFINLGDNVGLDTLGGGYAVFGTITTGTAFVASMAGAPCVASALVFAGECMPVPNLVVTRAERTQ